MRALLWFAVLVGIFCGLEPAWAFREGTITAGLGYYSQNTFNKVSKEASGQKGFWGEILYPINFQYDFRLDESWYLAPQLSYTFLPRKSAGDTAKVTFFHLVFPFGTQISESTENIWDWYVGPGFIQYRIEGAGGTVQMNNGTGTSTFAVPGATATIQKVTTNLGTSFEYLRARIALDLIFENIFSNTKRTQNLMLSFSYRFGGGT